MNLIMILPLHFIRSNFTLVLEIIMIINIIVNVQFRYVRRREKMR